MDAKGHWLPGVLVAGVAILSIAGATTFAHRALRAAKAPRATAAVTVGIRLAPPAGIGPWTIACTGAKPACAIEQDIAAPGTGGTAGAAAPGLHVSIVALAGSDNKLGMVLTLPLGILLPAGVSFQLDQTPPATAPVQSCLPGGCRVALVVNQGGRDRLAASQVLRVSYVQGDGKQVVLPISLDRFAEALKRIFRTPPG
jgi:invasion protein IalB